MVGCLTLVDGLTQIDGSSIVRRLAKFVYAVVLLLRDMLVFLTVRFSSAVRWAKCCAVHCKRVCSQDASDWEYVRLACLCYAYCFGYSDWSYCVSQGLFCMVVLWFYWHWVVQWQLWNSPGWPVTT